MNDETNLQSSESVDCSDNEQDKEIIQTPTTSTYQDQLRLIESTRIRTRKSGAGLQKEETTRQRKKLWNLERMINYFGYFIITIGIAITLSSTYINIWNTIRYVRFTQPCIVNITAS